jgi:excisionase family DNA binding protein
MQDTIFSTADLADLLRVSCATVKRWADNDRVRCFKTPGGHRKFRLSDIANFLERTGYRASGVLAAILNDARANQAVEQAVIARDLDAVVPAFERRALRGDVEGLGCLLSALSANGVRLSEAFDVVMKPAFRSIGERWRSGELTVVDEHIATNAAVEALGRVRGRIQPEPGDVRTAMCACLPGEYHELGIRAVAVILERHGFRATSSGADTPLDAIEARLRVRPTTLLALSAQRVPEDAETVAAIRRVAAAAARSGTTVVLGGPGFAHAPDEIRSLATVFESCAAFATALRNGLLGNGAVSTNGGNGHPAGSKT